MQRKKRVSNPRPFILLAILATLLMVSFPAQNFLQTTLPVKLQDTLTLSLGILYEALPFVFLGVAIAVTVQIFIRQQTIFRLLPKQAWIRRPMLSLLGVFLPVCECGNVPLARGLIAKGLKPSEVLTFLFAAPIINPVTIYTTAQAFQFDNRVVVIRVVAAFIIAQLVGVLFIRYKRRDMLKTEFINYCDAHHHSQNGVANWQQKTSRYVSDFADETQKLMPALVGGSLLAGIIQTAIPRSILTTVSQQPLLAILALIALAFVVSICANVDAFFALSLSSVFPLSAIVAFLVFGPMVDIKMLALLRTTFTRPVILYVSGIISLASVLTGLVVAYAF